MMFYGVIILIVLSFLFILTGLCVVSACVLLLTLHTAGSGKWPGFLPHQWDKRLRKLLLGTGIGLILTLVGILAGYGI